MDPNSILSQVSVWLVSLGVTGAIATGGAFWTFRLFAKEWLKAQFDQDLEEFRAEKSKEIERLKTEYQQETERLKSEISRLLDRATRLHSQEYEVLPHAWGLLNKAIGAVGGTIQSIQKQPDLDNMPDEKLNEILESLDLGDSQKSEIFASNDKNRTYAKIATWKKIGLGNTLIQDCQNYIIINGIFISQDLYDKFYKACVSLKMAIMNREFVENFQGHGYWDEALKELTKAENLTEEIKKEIRNHLWDTKITN